MKKDKKWFVDKWTEERDKSAVHDPMYHFINEFITDVKLLDEPEVLSQKWIEKHTWNNHYIGEPFVYVKDLQNLIVPKKELPVIPKYVADWITKYREALDLYPALRRLEDNTSIWGRVYEWYRTNTHDFVNAYLTGEYEVEEEPLYFALIKGHELITDADDWTCKYWNISVPDSRVFPADQFSIHGRYSTRMSKEEWGKYGINDTNADFINIGEVQ